MKIAIDGPSGAGKSTVARLLAARLGIDYLDTGAMYRAVALKIRNLCVSSDDTASVDNILASTDIKIEYDNGEPRVYLDGKDVTGRLREHSLSKFASEVSARPNVRTKMVELQRGLAAARDTVLDGRDIGTFVLPDADFKFYLTASISERARRRLEELREKGAECDYSQVERDIIERDHNDSHRLLAPLKKADDAFEIDSTSLTAEEVAALMERMIGEKL